MARHHLLSGGKFPSMWKLTKLTISSYSKKASTLTLMSNKSHKSQMRLDEDKKAKEEEG